MWSRPVHIWLVITVESEEICTQQGAWCLQWHRNRKRTTSALRNCSSTRGHHSGPPSTGDDCWVIYRQLCNLPQLQLLTLWLTDVWALFKCVSISGRGRRERATETEDRSYLCVCVRVCVCVRAGMCNESQQASSQLSGTSQLFDPLNSEHNLSSTQGAHNWLFLDMISRSC